MRQNFDTSTESLVLTDVLDSSPDELGSKIPISEPGELVLFFSKSLTELGRQRMHSLLGQKLRKLVQQFCTADFRPIFLTTTLTVLIYSCPPSSPIKHRMLYSSGASFAYQGAKRLIPANLLAPRRIETSDPTELNAAFLQDRLSHSGEGSNSGAGTPAPNTEETRAFARPKGPGRRR